jgi:uncharacterized protein (TIGR02271 family)
MARKRQMIVDQKGVRATVIETRTDQDPQRVVVQTESGRRILLPVHILVAKSDGDYSVPLSFAEVEHQAGAETVEHLIIPLISEQIQVRKETRETGGVRLTRVVHEEEQTIDEPLLREEIEVERVEINRPIDKIPDNRTEGDTLIIPVVEEELVVEKRLVLRQEIHVRKKRTESHSPQQVTVRREDVRVERLDAADDGEEVMGT